MTKDKDEMKRSKLMQNTVISRHQGEILLQNYCHHALKPCRTLGQWGDIFQQFLQILIFLDTDRDTIRIQN